MCWSSEACLSSPDCCPEPLAHLSSFLPSNSSWVFTRQFKSRAEPNLLLLPRRVLVSTASWRSLKPGNQRGFLYLAFWSLTHTHRHLKKLLSPVDSISLLSAVSILPFPWPLFLFFFRHLVPAKSPSPPLPPSPHGPKPHWTPCPQVFPPINPLLCSKRDWHV